MTAKLISVIQTLLLNFRLGYPTSYSVSKSMNKPTGPSLNTCSPPAPILQVITTNS